MLLGESLTTELVKSSWTWKKFGDKVCKVLQIHSHRRGTECMTCQRIDKQTLPNKTVCFVTLSTHNNDSPNVNVKCVKNTVKFEIDNQPQNFVFANRPNEEQFVSRPFIHEAPISTTRIIIGRPPIRFWNEGNDCYVISGKCYFSKNNPK